VNDIDRIAERPDDEARAAGVPEDALDEAVHNTAQEVHLAELNSLEDEEDQEDHISRIERLASNINNGASLSKPGSSSRTTGPSNNSAMPSVSHSREQMFAAENAASHRGESGEGPTGLTEQEIGKAWSTPDGMTDFSLLTSQQSEKRQDRTTSNEPKVTARCWFSPPQRRLAPGGLLLPASPIRDLFSRRWWRSGRTRSRSLTWIRRWSSGLMREWDGRAPSPHGGLLAAAAPAYRSLNGRMHLSVGRNPAKTVDRSGSMPDSTPRPRLVKAFGIICAYRGTVFLLPPTEH
jgi:hypothetical protein